jgi:hypothetical protein
LAVVFCAVRVALIAVALIAVAHREIATTFADDCAAWSGSLTRERPDAAGTN